MDQNLNFIEVDILFDEHDDMTMENGLFRPRGWKEEKKKNQKMP